MTVRCLARGCRVLLPALLLGLLIYPKPEVSAEDPPRRVPEAPPPKMMENGWTFDEARDRLALSTRDPYLQYVLLQLGRRDGREREAVDAIEGVNLLGQLPLFREDRGRRARADLFSTFTGAVAIQESLQLDTMRGENPNNRGPQRNVPDQPEQPGQPQKPNLPEKVAVATLSGPTVPSHPWEKMLGGKKPDVGPLAGFVPEEFYFAEFRSVVRLHEVLGTGQLWAGHVFTQALGGARSQQTSDRLRKQLGLSGLTPEQIDKLGVDAIAVTGSDPFLSEGSDVTVLVRGKSIATLAALADVANGGRSEKGEHAGIAYTFRSSADGAVNAYAASPKPDLHVRSNSLPAFKKVLEAVSGKAADGKVAKRLGESAEFRYVRTRMTRDDTEDGFVYLSDAFIRKLTGPQVKLTERRRVLVYNHLRMIGHAALMFRTEHGRAPKSLEELAEAKCAPGVFGAGELAHPDGGAYSLSADGMSGVCSKYGRAEGLTPCIERLVTEVTGAEAEEYKQFVAEYSEYWRTFFDPIAIKVTTTAKQFRLETLVLPLIDNSIYTELARGAGKPVPMDLLPTPKREIGGLWVHFPKKELLDALGPEQPSKEPEPGDRVFPLGPVGRVRQASNRMRAANDLKQIGLAAHNFHDTTGAFPDDIRDKNGKPLLSWRVAILPYVEQDPLYKEFKLDEPWDSAHNKKLIGRMPPVFAGREPGGIGGKTTFVRPAGKGTLFPPDKKLKLTDVTDGTSNTILAVESSDPVEWTRPADLPVDPKQPLKGLVRKDGDPFQALFADGSVRSVPRGVEPAELLKAFDPADGQPGNLDARAKADTRPKAPFEVQNDLKQIGLAVHNYNDATGQLPLTNIRGKDGKPLLSWRVAILPYIEQDALYKQFKLDEPWDSANNKKLVEKMPRIYYTADAKLNAAGRTGLLTLSGNNTLSPPNGGKFTIAGIADGTSNTVLAVLADPERAVEWTKPDDLPFDPKDPLKGVIRPGQEGIDVVMADGATRRFSPRIDPKKFAAMATPNGGEVVTLGAGDEVSPLAGSGPGPAQWLQGLRLSPDELQRLEEEGVDLNKLRRFLRDGIGDQIGLHMHDAPRLLDSDLSGLFGGGDNAGLGAIGMGVRFVFGASSVSIPVKDAKVVDEYLEELDKVFLARRQDLKQTGVVWRREVDFYRVAFPKPHTIRCVMVNIAGLKWRVYWGRIGDGLYLATRPFILEDIATAHAEGKKPTKTEPAHAVLRLRPENWKEVLPGYNLGWAESNRAACHANLDMLSNVRRGWNDRRPLAGPPDAELMNRVGRVYGERPFCPDGGTYTLSDDVRACRCSIHGGHDDPHQPAGPTAQSATGRVLKSFGGLTATVRFEEDGLRVVVTMDRKE